MKSKMKWAIGSGVALAISMAAFFAGRAYAAGIPAAKALVYTGLLQNADGSPFTATGHNIEIKLWNDVAGTAANNQLCDTSSQPLTTDSTGHFSQTLGDDCTAGIGANKDTYVEILLDGAVLGGKRTKLWAVPYAIEANHAVSATTADGATGTLAEQIVPGGAVMPFDLDACPTGWTEYMAARGRTVIGTNPANAGNGLMVHNRGDTLGEESHSLSVAELAPHTHTETVFGQVGAFTNYATGLSIVGGSKVSTTYGESETSASTGSATAFTNFQPSIALIWCKKN